MTGRLSNRIPSTNEKITMISIRFISVVLEVINKPGLTLAMDTELRFSDWMGKPIEGFNQEE